MKSFNTVKNLLRIGGFLVLALGMQAAHAWKPRTHVYLAEQVLNEALLYDSVIIYGSNDSAIGKFAIDPKVNLAIKQNQAQFRAGAMGPDAYPDILTGQMLIHPRLPGSFRWINYLSGLTKNSNGADRAFVAGYISHAAGDLFGHTFINHFAGGPFELGVNAVKHTVVESYLDNHLPPTLKLNTAALVESEVSIGGGVSQFIYRNMIVASPGSELETRLFKGPRGKLSIPCVFSRLRNGLQSDISGYYAQVADFGRQYDATVAAAQQCAWLDFSCSKTALYAKAGVIAGEKAAYRLLKGPITTYEEHWRDDIDTGLAAFPALSHEVALSLFGLGPADLDRAQRACGNYVLDHLLSMAGAPDVLGTTIAVILDILSAIVPRFIIDAIAEMKRDLFNFLLVNTVGMTVEDAKKYFSDPGIYFGTLGLDLNSYRTGELHFTAADSTVHYMNVAPLFNTANMIKLTMLDSMETMRLFKAIGADTSVVRIPDGSLMAGEWFWSLDESRQWATSQEKGLIMPLYADTVAFYRIFKHQTGENDNFPSPFADTSMNDTSLAGAPSFLPNDLQIGTLNSRKDKFVSYNSVYMPHDGQIDVYATPLEASLRPVALYLEHSNGWLIEQDASRTGIAHAAWSHLRKGFYLFEVIGEVGNVCDNEYSFPPNWWPPDNKCNLWGGFGKYVVWCNYTPAAVVDTEPDDSWQSAMDIPLDSAVLRTLGYVGLHQNAPLTDITDVMKFRLPSGGDCVIELAAGEKLIPTLEVYDSLGNTLVSVTGRFQSIPLCGLDKRTYYIETGLTGDSSYGAYSVSVRTAPAFSADSEKNDMFGSGKTIPGNVVARGTLDQNDTVDWYSIKSDSMGRIEVTLNECGGLKAGLALFDSGGTRVNAVDSCAVTRCNIAWTVSRPATFHLRVSMESGEGVYELVAEGIKTNGVSFHPQRGAFAHRISSIRSGPGGTLQVTIVSEKAGRGEIRLADMRGRIVSVLWRGNITAGNTKLLFPVKGLSSGLYIARIASPDRVECMKVLVKN